MLLKDKPAFSLAFRSATCLFCGFAGEFSGCRIARNSFHIQYSDRVSLLCELSGVSQDLPNV